VTPDRPPPVVLVVGAASRDIAPDDPRGWRLGGAVTYSSLTLARLGLHVRALVGVDRAAATATELDELRAAGVSVALAHLSSGPVFENIEAADARRQRCLSAAETIARTALPRMWTSGFDGLLLGPVAGELPEDWALLAAGDPHPVVALGWQGLLRAVVAGHDVQRVPPRRDPLVAAAALVGSSRDDFAADTAPEAAVALLSPGATLVVTEGQAGGLILERRGDAKRPVSSRYDAIPSDSAVDPTGAGDVFLAAMLAGRLQPSLGDPLLIAAAAASLTVEALGLAGVPDLAAVRRRATRAPSLDSRRPSAASNLDSGRPSQA
jgi:sugar/nucleoside kinase (ribokinase family)